MTQPTFAAKVVDTIMWVVNRAEEKFEVAFDSFSIVIVVREGECNSKEVSFKFVVGWKSDCLFLCSLIGFCEEWA